MIALIEAKRAELASLCRAYFVARLDLFGSAASGEFEEARSDLDFLVTFSGHPDLTAFEQYFGFKEALEALFGRQVDLVMERALRNPYFIRSVNESRLPLYAA